MGMMASTASTQRSRFERTFVPNGCNSPAQHLTHSELDSAARQEVQRRHPLRDTVWLIRGRLNYAVTEADIRLVRWLAAPRNTSGAEECEYSSRKWCSTSQA